MSVTKTVAGGTAFVGTFGTAGYGINKYINKDEGKIEIEFLYEEFKEGTVGKKIEDSNFLIIHNKHNTFDWERLIENNYGAGNKKIEEIQEECKQLLTANFTTVDNNYKSAIKKCTKVVTFKERMEQMSIEFLKDYTTDHIDANGMDGNYVKWNKIKDKFDAEIVGGSSIEMVTKGKGNMAKWKEYCKKESNMDLTKTKKDFDKEWSAFVEACSQEANNPGGYWIIK